MKILIDLQCCQTEARDRGIGRFTLSLAQQIVHQGRGNQFQFLLNAKFLNNSSRLLDTLTRLGLSDAIVLFDYPEVEGVYEDRLPRERVANALRNAQVTAASPDIYHISSLFEGESVFGRAPAFTSLPTGPFITSATLYDFIPSILPEHYLTHWQYVNWYKRAMGVARCLDLGLAISESARRDARDLLHMPSRQVINIFGSVDDHFKVLEQPHVLQGSVWRQLNPDQQFILYVAGPDYRKNLDRTLESFSLLTLNLRKRLKLVIVLSADRALLYRIQELAQRLAITANLLVLGHVTEIELVELYNRCALFIFPSLYEGLGLPVIEAMRCGAPVLVGDNSSLIEIVDEPDFRFNALDARSMAEAMQRALSDTKQLRNMRLYSLRRAALFSWEGTAQRTLEAWERAYEERQKHTAAGPVGRSARQPRIAMFTPLPGVKSGISDYSADLLSAISQISATDVFVDDISEVNIGNLNIQIWHHSLFYEKSDEFEVIVYQIGNSPYHHYMLPYLDVFPGVVVLHDAFLGHLTHDPGNPGPFYRRVISEQGSAARAMLLAAKGESVAIDMIDRFPCSAFILRKSIGAIVHSKFARDILEADSQSKLHPPIAVLPQFRGIISPSERVSRAEARRKLGLSDDVLLIISLGHVAPTKGIIELVEGFLASKTGATKDASLIFVGELEGGAAKETPFARDVKNIMKNHSNINVTGFVSNEVYQFYLSAADFGVQLRTVTRGETSRSILDMIAQGLPFIFNRLGATAELMVGHVVETCAPQDVAHAIDFLAGDDSQRELLAKAISDFASHALEPKKLAVQFVNTVLDMKARADSSAAHVLPATIARLLRGTAVSKDLVHDIARAATRQRHFNLPPRLLLDVTHIRDNDLGTGVQRVVRELTRATYAWPDARLHAQAFAFTDRGLVYADDYAQRCGARADIEMDSVCSGPIEFRPFDRLLMADGTWHLTDWMLSPIDQLNALGGSAFGFVHDILPLQNPELFLDHVAASVLRWLSLVAGKGAGLICSSVSGADALISFLRKGEIVVRKGLRIGVARLGADFQAHGDLITEIHSKISQLAKHSDFFLMVGSIEPRKGHAYVLDAFEELWAAGENAVLVVVGKVGWNVDELVRRFENHPESGRRFFYLGHLPESDLVNLYRSASGTIVASVAEGFGLPIIEAAHHGSPLLLSDIPVFREIGGQSARYFAPGSAPALGDAIRAHLKDGPVLSSGIKPRSWRQYTEDLIAFMDGKDTHHVF